MPWHFSIIANASAASTANLLEGYNEDDDGECSGTNFVIAVKPHQATPGDKVQGRLTTQFSVKYLFREANIA